MKSLAPGQKCNSCFTIVPKDRNGTCLRWVGGWLALSLDPPGVASLLCPVSAGACGKSVGILTRFLWIGRHWVEPHRSFKDK